MFQLIIRWILFALALLCVAWVVPGITLDSFMTALWTALIIGLVNIFIRPVLLILTLPINLLTLGLLTLFINGLMFWMVATFVNGFAVEGFLSAFFGALMLSLLSMLINEV